MHFQKTLLMLICALTCTATFAQLTGSVSGKVTTPEGEALPGVTVEASSSVLPQARVTTTSGTGEYRFPILPPGDYTIEFTLAGMGNQTRAVKVYLAQDTMVNASLGVQALTETITVMAEAPLIDPNSTEIKSGLSNEDFQDLPKGQEYRDLLKLIPSVNYTEDVARGQNAGGSGQDNVYQFDGVNVSRPQYGSLRNEASAHDIDQISVVKGGARAVDFVRSGGFTVNSVSKSGTNKFSGLVSYQVQTDSMAADLEVQTGARWDQDKTWATIGLGGPVLPDRLFFYGSYFRPEVEQSSRSNNYGPVPTFKSTRDELFGKLTYTPTSSILVHGSYRDSQRDYEGDVGVTLSPSTAGTTSSGGEVTFKVGILEASWVVNQRSFATFKFTDYTNENHDRPDRLFDFPLAVDGSVKLDVSNLDQQGRFFVPQPVAGQTAYNQFIVPLIERYGFAQDGGRRGGGIVGAGRDINNQDFFRQSYQVGYDYVFGSTVSHDLHVGYQWYEDKEDLDRIRNGWGDITVPGGRTNCPAACGPNSGQPIFYTAQIIRGGLREFPLRNIVSSIESNNLEVNDRIGWNNWTFNVGVLVSHDTLYGQGLREDPSTISGYVLAIGNKYKMYEIDWDKMIQPRLGATWAYNGSDSVFANYARYNPAATSLPRAASWDRNSNALLYDVHFDRDGNLIGFAPVGSSTGKLFVDDLDPRYTDEYLLGTSQQITSRWTGRVYTRYRYSTNFWEDTSNNTRVRWAPEGYPKELYMADLVPKLTQIGTGGSDGSYVIAELDNAFTKYWEASLESEWRGGPMFLRGSYTWGHYYGNFDQDNTNPADANDADIFIGSSNIADGAGRQIWDNKYGDLRGDRRHILKLYGSRQLPWNASAGAFALYQSGQPWEIWDYRAYTHLPGFGTSTSDLIRFAEPAGSRRSDDHYQVDLNYTQSFQIGGYGLQLIGDAYNVTDNQTGYDIAPRRNSAGFGEPRRYYAPRRFQVAARFQF